MPSSTAMTVTAADGSGCDDRSRAPIIRIAPA
jgi:hypothetical protein